jgi:hypothetical protein
MNRFRLAALALFCLVATGCVEGEVTYTVNPDGSAKVHFDVVTVKAPEVYGGPPKKGGTDVTLDDMLRDSLRQMLQAQGVSAWKDVSAEFLPNGKVKISGTAYVRRLQDFKPQSPPLLEPMYGFEKGAGGEFKLTAKKTESLQNDSKRKRKSPEELKKLSDEELDKYVLMDLIELQSTRPLVVAMFGGAKLKATYVLPGDPTEVRGLARDGRKVSSMLEGDKLVTAVDKLLARDKATHRKVYRGLTDPDVWALLEVDGFPGKGSVTVAKPGGAQFDFDAEVKAARDAYPALKKKFGFGDDLRLPMTDPPPPVKRD